MGDRLMKERPVDPGDVIDQFGSTLEAKGEVTIAEIDQDGCVVQIQLANTRLGILPKMDLRRVDTPSGPHLVTVPQESDPGTVTFVRLQCLADEGAQGPFRVRYFFRWVV